MGRKAKPTAIRRREGNPGKRAWNHGEPIPPEVIPDCPEHLSDVAAAEWHRVAATLHEMGVLSTVDRAALAAYCQAYGRWVEAEERMRQTPLLIRTPSGYPQQSPWLSIANKQLELMAKFMAELGMTPSSRSRVNLGSDPRMAISDTPLSLDALLEDVAQHGRRLGHPDTPERERARKEAADAWVEKHGVVRVKPT